MPLTTRSPGSKLSAVEQLLALGWEINANQYRAVHLAAEYDTSLEWLSGGYKNAALAIAKQLDISTTTAREWIRIGHALEYLPLIDAAFRDQTISYAKARILTRSADNDNEQELLDLAHDRSADRLTIAIAKALADNDEADDARDRRLHDFRGVTTYTDADGMTVIRVVLPPDVAKHVVAAVDETVRLIAQTPEPGLAPRTENAPAGANFRRCAVDPQKSTAQSDQASSVEASEKPSLDETLRDLRQRWQPTDADDWIFPTFGQQRADALVALFLQRNISLTTEVVLHVRGDGNTLDDGTPLTNNAIARQLDHSFIRLLIHGTDGKPIDATNRRRYPTTRQKRVVAEAHNHECADCGCTSLIEYDHNPPYEQTHHTVTTELELRCRGCHRTRHLLEDLAKAA